MSMNCILTQYTQEKVSILSIQLSRFTWYIWVCWVLTELSTHYYWIWIGSQFILILNTHLYFLSTCVCHQCPSSSNLSTHYPIFSALFLTIQVDSPFDSQKENYALLNSNSNSNKKLTKRSQRIHELYETEKRFVNILHTIILVRISILVFTTLSIFHVGLSFVCLFVSSISSSPLRHRTRQLAQYWTKPNWRKSLAICRQYMKYIARSKTVWKPYHNGS